MNIFILDENPKKCAEYHNDKHVVKMILETAQLLCGVHHMVESKLDVPYKLSHKNHPCSIWARECIENYVWLCDLGMELCLEYTYRYGKRHKSQDIIEWCIINHPPIKEIGELTPFRLAMNAGDAKSRQNSTASGAASGNQHFVYDSSDYIRFKRLQNKNRNYNDPASH